MKKWDDRKNGQKRNRKPVGKWAGRAACWLLFGLILAGGALLNGCAAKEAEESGAKETYTVGICQLAQHAALDSATQGFKDALLQELPGEVTFDEQNAQGETAACTTIVSGFVANQVDLIMANATPALQAAVSATAEIPILGTSVTDYEAALNMSFDPAVGTGVNVSGSSDGVPAELYAELLLELCPEVSKVSILYCSAEANSALQADSFAAAMRSAAPDVTCEVFTFSDSNDIQMVTTAAVEGSDALYIPTDNQAASNMTIIRSVCEGAKIPVITGEENMCAAGGLATVSISYYDIGFACGLQAAKVLKGEAKVGSLPIAYAKDPVKEYNPDYAAAIGFSVPEGFAPIGK